MSAPAFRITLDGLDLTPKLKPRLVSLTLTECRGDEADQLDIVLDDADGLLDIPSKGAKVALQIGWDHTGLVDKGVFTVDEVEHAGAPDTITLRARSADLLDAFRKLQERSFHEATLGAIIELIAFEHELTAAVSEPLRGIAIKHIDQTRESDAAFLRRLGKQYDAVATVKNDHLMFLSASESQTASGKELPVIVLTRTAGDQHRYHSAERDAYSGVLVHWYDQRHAMRRTVVAGTPGNSKRLRQTYASESDARAAASAEWERIRRGLQTFSLSLALGNPMLMPQSPVVVRGFNRKIDETEWLCVKITHNISNSGFTTQIEAETKIEPEGAVRNDDNTDHDAGITGVAADWQDKARAKQTKGTEYAGSKEKLKKLNHVYASRQTAKRAAKREWEAIKERREIIKENLAAEG